MKGNRDLTTTENICCYGGFSERWKHDAYERRKTWLKNNRVKLIVGAALTIAVALIFILH